MTSAILSPEYTNFLEHLKERVATSRYKASISVNKELILLYHYIGTEILKRQKSFGWGTKVIENISRDLRIAFPDMKGFSLANLANMRRFAQEYEDPKILQQAAGELPWYHHVILMEKVKSGQGKTFYIQKAVQYGWSRNVLVHHIESGLYEREGKAINNFGLKLPPIQSDLAQQTLKDPYLFDFLSIGDEANEREIERTLMVHMEKFLLELGAGFAFVGRQYKLSVGTEDYYIDLLFYHLKLRCYVLIELKTGKFKPEYAGKMNFYLSAVDDILKHSNDNPSIGIILCKDKGEQIKAEYALRDISKPIGLAEYRLTDSLPEDIKTSLPSIEELEAELSRDFKQDKE